MVIVTEVGVKIIEGKVVDVHGVWCWVFGCLGECQAAVSISRMMAACASSSAVGLAEASLA